ncbi:MULTISPECIES: nitronate monooxygenase [Mammaliicoccus]|uniref:Probable nitronate monooxygenase n=1 Tax=Mammaliicoccus fleurettii TaxID=150056 RepID=A0ABS5MND3_9STAP|nr:MULTISPECIES: nitronate monooxygenase [Mammaliicoccus]MBL0847757.1 nitronate monooxygenase [Mammaliicoccus fleurettii]MBS3672513.1 nitronate monooxygenase [Mammaliicoccus fleurettii]MBS3697443.1 nitronate monooxygenase [Mammaliicoccus fleurettii]MBW0765508.1 nitronate monooxygenase [Mammaliicoccus fleurettii]MEB6200982.1 nitronate monooxygenase [Mammaliicoccus fleurettii]
METNTVLSRLQITKPIFLAGMAGGVTTPNLVAAVSNEGGLGQIGAGYMTPETLAKDIDQIREMTQNPFGVNLFVPEFPEINQEKIDNMNNLLKPIAEKLNYERVNEVSIEDNFDEMIDIIIEKNVEIVSFTFGKPSQHLVQKLHQHHIIVIGTGTNFEEVKALEDIGVDAIVLQGSEAGGHRGSFKQELPYVRLTLEELFNQTYNKVNLPLVVAGGITTPEQAKYYIEKGAAAVQLGTAFLTTKESGAPNIHKESILKAKSEEITLTNTFSGRYANGINNTYIKYMEQFKESICSYPIQNKLTQPMRGQSKKLENPDYMNLWCGTHPEGAKDETVAELMKRYYIE